MSPTTHLPANGAVSTADVIEITAGDLRAGILPRLGGSLTHLIWRHPDGRPDSGEVDLLRRSSAADIASGNPSRLASFVMVPFANRIDGGRIPLPDGSPHGTEVHIPVDRPEQNVAIHGFGRRAVWEVMDQSATAVTLRQDFSAAGNPYRYRAEQAFSIDSGGTALLALVSVTNTGDRQLPFGLGFHPWLDRTADMRLAVASAHAFQMDGRQMPLAALAVRDVAGCDMTGGASFAVAERTPFDTPVLNPDRRAMVIWPQRRTRLLFESSDSLPLLHIFAPPTPAVFCIEPVSHMPDVVNRRHLSQYGDMIWLSPGERLAGHMRLVASLDRGRVS